MQCCIVAKDVVNARRVGLSDFELGADAYLAKGRSASVVRGELRDHVDDKACVDSAAKDFRNGLAHIAVHADDVGTLVCSDEAIDGCCKVRFIEVVSFAPSRGTSDAVVNRDTDGVALVADRKAELDPSSRLQKIGARPRNVIVRSQGFDALRHSSANTSPTYAVIGFGNIAYLAKEDVEFRGTESFVHILRGVQRHVELRATKAVGGETGPLGVPCTTSAHNI